MSLNKCKGNMYSWITHTHSHMEGRCPHQCSYCYVTALTKRFPSMMDKYTGALRLNKNELKVNYGSGKTIFIEHMNDTFAGDVPIEYICEIFEHCYEYPDNTYVFQTKNPARLFENSRHLPVKCVLGTTIETNLWGRGDCKAPHPIERVRAMAALRQSYPCVKLFVTIEPILNFDEDIMLDWLDIIRPDFVNIGADSKGYGLIEPSADKVRVLIDSIKTLGIEIKQKKNLERLLK